MNREYPCIVKADGIYLYDEKGKRYIDSASGPILCNLGHGIDEMADVLYFLTRMAQRYDIDLSDALEKKIEKNKEKYPIDKYKGSNKKYNELD